ncbi:hypothetical protein ACFQU1_04695 [Chelatococcus sp. GCM10030263]|uniref:hypothetical protein n=1 Tax=Chelatococcus sp. GCM10030263 TaxID=3273387 RepID=UPI00362467D5
MASLVLAACATVPPHSMDLSAFQRFKIAQVAVKGVKVVRSWPSQEEAYLKTHAVDPSVARRLQNEPSWNFPEVQEQFQTALDDQFGAEFGSQITPLFTGAKPLKAVVRLKIFDVPSVARRVFVESRPKIQAEIDLVDAKTGALVLKYDGVYRSREIGGGIGTALAMAINSSDPGYVLIGEYVS